MKKDVSREAPEELGFTTQTMPSSPWFQKPELSWYQNETVFILNKKPVYFDTISALQLCFKHEKKAFAWAAGTRL